MITNNFINRHNGPSPSDEVVMLKKIGVESVEALVGEIIPENIRLKSDLDLPAGMNELEFTTWINRLGAKNKIYKTYIGMGYYNTILPGVIQRNILENPGWYTSYTPYQAEISQGRLEALLNFQTVIVELTGLPIANCSLLDEGTAAAEAMALAFYARSREKKKNNANKFFVSKDIFPQTIAVIQTRALPLGIEVVIDSADNANVDEGFFGAIMQYPNANGVVDDYREFVQHIHAVGALAIVAADIMSLAILTPPGEWNADIVVGSTQRFGLPMAFGGPHAGYIATKEDLKRIIPGRIIGVSIDKKGNKALRMALQTREQHIKRERATSNICTAQALLAIMSGFYAIYHGPEGLKAIASDIHATASKLHEALTKSGFKQCNETFFDTLMIELPEQIKMDQIREAALLKEMNFRYFNDTHLGISVDETTSIKDVESIVALFSSFLPQKQEVLISEPTREYFPTTCKRTSLFMQQSLFQKYHSETAMMRYMKKLENRDISLMRSMIPLGSCTMKLNAATELFPLSSPYFGSIHPFVPDDQAEGYLEMISDFNEMLKKITGLDQISFQPNSGASGEYAGLLVIREYHKHNNQAQRNVCLIPSSAHGTNPASAVMAGMQVVVVNSKPNGDIDIDDLREKAVKYSDVLAAAMITYPSTHGIFEQGITEIVDIVHENGGQVYMDGANMNAQVAFTNPGFIGIDVCHLNLHKTFAIPHGGGGPGVGPIGVRAHLIPFLPGNVVKGFSSPLAIKGVSSAPFGSPLILPISYGYIKMLGGEGLKRATAYAMLNANYLKEALKDHYKVLYTGNNGRVAHEFIIDCNEFLHRANVPVIEISKRLQDYGIHSPTVAFPVVGTLMIEPTESEPLSELDRFVTAMINIRKEIKEIEDGLADKNNNVIHNAPHTCEMVTDDNWEYPYSRRKAAFPVSNNFADKYWPPVTKIDDGYGDRNLICTCDTLESYVDSDTQSAE